MLTVTQVCEIEMLAMRGKAVASLLGSSTSFEFEGCAPEDLSLAVYALECYFKEILEQLRTTSTGPQPADL